VPQGIVVDDIWHHIGQFFWWNSCYSYQPVSVIFYRLQRS